jgi:NitT/TauT family transport system substrate-binding protein
MTPDHVAGPAAGRRQLVRSRHLWLAAAAAMSVLLAAGCSNGGGGGTPVSATVTVAAVPGVNDAPLWLAQEKGLFTAEGLHVKINTVDSDAAAIAEVENGQAQIAASDYGNIVARQAISNLQTHKGQLHLLADGYDAGTGNVEILVRDSSDPITNPAELKGKTIGIPSELTIDTPATGSVSATNTAPPTTVRAGYPSSLDAVAASQDLSNYLLDVSLVVNWKPMPEQQEINELASGQVPAVLLTQPYVYEAEAKFGAIELTDAFGGQTASMPLSGYVSLYSWAKGNSAAVADFTSALDSANSRASTMGPIQDVLQTSPISLTKAYADMASLGTYPTAVSSDEIERVTQLMTNAGIVTVDTKGFLQSLLG